jgi:hypothetical protein
MIQVRGYYYFVDDDAGASYWILLLELAAQTSEAATVGCGVVRAKTEGATATHGTEANGEAGA